MLSLVIMAILTFIVPFAFNLRDVRVEKITINFIFEKFFYVHLFLVVAKTGKEVGFSHLIGPAVLVNGLLLFNHLNYLFALSIFLIARMK